MKFTMKQVMAGRRERQKVQLGHLYTVKERKERERERKEKRRGTNGMSDFNLRWHKRQGSGRLSVSVMMWMNVRGDASLVHKWRRQVEAVLTSRKGCRSNRLAQPAGSSLFVSAPSRLLS